MRAIFTRTRQGRRAARVIFDRDNRRRDRIGTKRLLASCPYPSPMAPLRPFEPGERWPRRCPLRDLSVMSCVGSMRRGLPVSSQPSGFECPEVIARPPLGRGTGEDRDPAKYSTRHYREPPVQFGTNSIARGCSGQNEGDRHESRISIIDGPVGSACDCRLPEPGQDRGPPSGAQAKSPPGFPGASQEGQDGTLGNLGGLLGGTSVGGLLGERFAGADREFQIQRTRRNRGFLGQEPGRTSRSRRRSSSARSAPRSGRP